MHTKAAAIAEGKRHIPEGLAAAASVDAYFAAVTGSAGNPAPSQLPAWVVEINNITDVRTGGQALHPNTMVMHHYVVVLADADLHGVYMLTCQ
jgi:hypothetical protein